MELSSTRAPITPLEFDLSAKPFAQGLAQALAQVLGVGAQVSVGVRRGWLYAEVELDEDPGEPVPRCLAATCPATDPASRWRDDLADLTSRAARAGDASELAEVVRDAFALHHRLVLPARLHVHRHYAAARAGELAVPPTDVLAALRAPRNPVSAGMAELAAHAAAGADDEALRGLAAASGWDDDTYGLRTDPGAEAEAALPRLAALYRRAGVEPDRLAGQVACAEAETAAARSRARHLLRGDAAAAFAHAAAGVGVLEDHGPPFHVGFFRVLRDAVARLAATPPRRRLADADAALFVTADELAGDGDLPAPAEIAARRRAFAAAGAAESVPRAITRADADRVSTAAAAPPGGRRCGDVAAYRSLTASTGDVEVGRPGATAASGYLRPASLAELLEWVAARPPGAVGRVAVSTHHADWVWALPLVESLRVSGGNYVGHPAMLLRAAACGGEGSGILSLRDEVRLVAG